MRNTLPHLLIATLLGGSTVAGLEVISPSPASERVSTAPHQGTNWAPSGESVVLVFPPVNRFGASSAGLKPGALSERVPHPVAVLRVKSDSAR